MKNIYFTKMQSLGNDFVVIDQLKNPIKFNKNDIKKISNRNYGRSIAWRSVAELSLG